MSKVTKVEGIKSKGARVKPYEKMEKETNKSAEKAPHDQLSGGAANKVKKG